MVAMKTSNVEATGRGQTKLGALQKNLSRENYYWLTYLVASQKVLIWLELA